MHMRIFIFKENDKEIAVLDLAFLVFADKGGTTNSIYVQVEGKQSEIIFNEAVQRDKEFTRLVTAYTDLSEQIQTAFIPIGEVH